MRKQNLLFVLPFTNFVRLYFRIVEKDYNFLTFLISKLIIWRIKIYHIIYVLLCSVSNFNNSWFYVRNEVLGYCMQTVDYWKKKTYKMEEESLGIKRVSPQYDIHAMTYNWQHIIQQIFMRYFSFWIIFSWD